MISKTSTFSSAVKCMATAAGTKKMHKFTYSPENVKRLVAVNCIGLKIQILGGKGSQQKPPNTG